jgi:hypothetical protein
MSSKIRPSTTIRPAVMYPGSSWPKTPKFEPPKPDDNYTLKMILDICRWMDGLEKSETRKQYYERKVKETDLSALESETVRKQVNLLWSIYCEIEELKQLRWQMDIGDSQTEIKTKIIEADKRFKVEYDTYLMYLKLASDRPVDGYFFTLLE